MADALIDRVNRVVDLLTSDEAFACPLCGAAHSISDSDVSQSVVSFWGEDPHNFCCFDCGEDFMVKETVTRKFETAKTVADLNAI